GALYTPARSSSGPGAGGAAGEPARECWCGAALCLEPLRVVCRVPDRSWHTDPQSRDRKHSAPRGILEQDTGPERAADAGQNDVEGKPVVQVPLSRDPAAYECSARLPEASIAGAQAKRRP